jgi:hypothetical protein
LQKPEKLRNRIIKAGNNPAIPIYREGGAEKSSAMMRTKQIPEGLRKAIGLSRFIGKGNCKEVFGNKNGNTVTDSENFARLLVLFLETEIVGNTCSLSLSMTRV